MTDPDARAAILRKFYDRYLEEGLHVIVMAGDVGKHLALDEAQVRRCFEYLVAKGLIRPMTRGGGYSPTVALVDAVEEGLVK